MPSNQGTFQIVFRQRASVKIGFAIEIQYRIYCIHPKTFLRFIENQSVHRNSFSVDSLETQIR